MKPYNRLRAATLTIASLAVAVVAVRVTICPTLCPITEKSAETPSQLPETVSLENWKVVSANNLDDQNAERPSYVKGKTYRYTQGQGKVNLSVQARYFVGTNGNVRIFIDSYLSDDSNSEDWELLSLEGTGSFLRKVDQQGVQLSSCVNPYGKSTVSAREYKHNRNFQDIRYRLIPWLFGESLKDERCLWTHMYLSASSDNLVERESLIEAAWIEWSQRWSSELPNMK